MHSIWRRSALIDGFDDPDVAIRAVFEQVVRGLAGTSPSCCELLFAAVLTDRERADARQMGVG